MEEKSQSVNGQNGLSKNHRNGKGVWTPSALQSAHLIPLAKAEPKPLELAEVRDKLSLKKGKEYWRSLDELANTPEFQELVAREFPRQAPRDWQPLSRREFLRVMGAGLALAGLSGCAYQPQEKIVPYVRAPEQLQNFWGKPLFFATAFTLNGYAQGLLAESQMGRPIKVEGNPDHPASKGATDAYAQASVLSLYDLDRSQAPIKLGENATWDQFVGELRTQVSGVPTTVATDRRDGTPGGLARAGGARAGQERNPQANEPGSVPANLRATRGAGLYILTETVTSPTLAAQMRDLQRLFPAMVWHQYDPTGSHAVREGARLAFGQYVQPMYNFRDADRIVSLDADFFSEDPGHVRYGRDWSSRRRVPFDEPGRERPTGAGHGEVEKKETTASPEEVEGPHGTEGTSPDSTAYDDSGFIQPQEQADAPATPTAEMNRMYAIESTMTLVGAKADHRLPVRASQIEEIARYIAAQVGVPGATGTLPTGINAQWMAAMIADLRAAKRGRTLIVPGMHQPPVVHAIAHHINQALGNVGKTVNYLEPVEVEPGDQFAGLRSLVNDMNAGKVKTLLILGGNPVHNAPADIPFADALVKLSQRRNAFTAQVGLHYDETASRCQWHVNGAHYLEAWSDARAFDGTASIIQPLIIPMYGGRSIHEVLSVLLEGHTDPSGYQIVRTYWQGQSRLTGDAFEKYWRAALNDGVIPNTAARPRPVRVSGPLPPATTRAGGAGTLEINFRPDPSIYDGRFANNGWLQELPKPFTSLTWDNAALLNPHTAKRLQVESGDMVTLRLNGRDMEAPVLVSPGQPADVVTMHLGYGRERGGKVAEGTGFNAYKIRTMAAPYFADGVQMNKLGRRYLLATTVSHHLIALEPGPDVKNAGEEIDDTFGRDIVRAGTIAQYKENPLFHRHEHHSTAGEHSGEAHTGEGQGEAHGAEHKAVHEANVHDSAHQVTNPAREDKSYLGIDVHESLFPVEKNVVPLPEGYKPYTWGMTIDLNACIGCHACTIACQAENNIATVGKNEVLRGREMHWLRIDSYFKGDVDNPATYFMPVPCMHCEKAPCEPVCPVQATSHSVEGINEMTYNRCVGTRYCSNNCPYKVRRFNFLQYTEQNQPTIQLMHNPDVTIRSRGVMEKCTYCIQRINQGRQEAQRENRTIQDGEVVTACQQVCPTEAIQFGDLLDPTTRVARQKKSPLNYGILTELNTQPRTTYLVALRNPNPAIEKLEGHTAEAAH